MNHPMMKFGVHLLLVCTLLFPGLSALAQTAPPDHTRMGICQACGVIRNTASGLQIAHYQLLLAIPNDLVDQFQKQIEGCKETLRCGPHAAAERLVQRGQIIRQALL